MLLVGGQWAAPESSSGIRAAAGLPGACGRVWGFCAAVQDATQCNTGLASNHAVHDVQGHQQLVHPCTFPSQPTDVHGPVGGVHAFRRLQVLTPT